MMDERKRQTLGNATSAAIPVLWALMASRGWSQAQLAAALTTDSGKVARLLYGIRKPGRDIAGKLLALGVAIELWSLPLPEGWTLPHVVVAAGESTRSLEADADKSDEWPKVDADTLLDLTRASSE